MNLEVVIKSTLDKIHHNYKASGGSYILTNCLSPTHTDEHGSFGINLETGKGHCFGCGFVVDTSYWLGDGELSDEMVEDLERGAMYSSLKKTLKSEEKRTGGTVFLPPKEKDVEPFRGLTAETIEQFGVYETGNVGKYHNRLIFPFVKGGYTLGYTGRDTTGESYAKWKHNAGFSSKDILYPYDVLKTMDCTTVLVCEGVMDTISAIQSGFPSICNFGVSLNMSEEKIADLYRLGVEEIVLCFDRDNAGAEAEELFLESPLITENFKVTKGVDYAPLSDYYLTDDCKDFNDYLLK